MIGRIFEGCAACGLEEILALKERRAAEVVRLGAFYGSPVICFKLNIAGSVKRFPLAVHFFSSAMKRISKALKQDKFVELFESVWKKQMRRYGFFCLQGGCACAEAPHVRDRG
jgi:phosphoribosyl-dephospho-CoA transferase